jgi:Fic family protein
MKPYEPRTLPIDDVDWPAHVTMIGRANAALARYDGMIQNIVNPAVLLSPLTTQEAVLSSRIEGTQASMEEVLRFEADPHEPIEPTRESDIKEILNYRVAIGHAKKKMKERPFCLNLLKELHAILLDSVRGRDKARGQFRRSQNFIGLPGDPIERASFIPPVWEHVEPSMNAWEKYFHSDEPDRLVQLAIVKAQFELIHPFLDGNGRLGRMLIPLFLFEKGLLSGPVFYLSAYLEKNRDTYYQKLRALSVDSDWNGWVAFFLRALEEQAVENTEKTKNIISLYEKMKREIPKAVKSQYAVAAIDALFARPIFQSRHFISLSKIPKDSALRILRGLKNKGFINEIRPGKGRRAAVAVFSELIRITRE